MKLAKISVVIPAFNRADLIGETIESLLAQTYSPSEIIVVDDGSTDGTADAVSRYRHPVRLFRQKNQGPGAARNLGFRHCSGDVVHFMDSDDISSPNTYEVQLKALNDTGADFAYGPWVKTRFFQKKVEFQPVVIQQRPIPAGATMDCWLLRGWVTVLQPCLLRRSLIERVGSYRTDLRPSEDSELLYRIGKSKAKLVHTPETILLYRVHPETQISTINSSARHNDWLNCLTVIDEHVSRNEELDWRTGIAFGFRKLDAIRGSSTEVNEQIKRLLETTPKSVLYFGRAVQPLRRILARARRMKYGDSYIPALGVAPMTNTQRKLVDRMGYERV